MLRTLTSDQKAELIEELADIEHEQWGHWTRCFFVFYNADNRKRWQQQSHTAYKNLSEDEKESDRVWARKVIQKIEELKMEILSK